MSIHERINLDIHIENITNEVNEAIAVGMEMCGLQMESYAKLRCPVDTGLLRNSIAHAVSGEVPSIGVSYKGTSRKARAYRSNDTHADTAATRKSGTAGKAVDPVQKGTYTNMVPKSKGTAVAYVGTAVYYAPYVEMGHIDPKTFKHYPAQPFIRPAVTDHMDEYGNILKNALSGVGNDN